MFRCVLKSIVNRHADILSKVMYILTIYNTVHTKTDDLFKVKLSMDVSGKALWYILMVCPRNNIHMYVYP